ncbi:MAG: methyltransferase domain-containing protein [Bacteroidetes bacterium]|nr:methyltransferase domain-containing protein [Bacteroidota bacterium]
MDNTIYPEEWFDSWFDSPYYELLYSKRDEWEARYFVQNLILWLKPKPQSLILDVGCGKGRYSKILADMDFRVTGIDISTSSLNIARKMENERLHFFKHDMRKPFLQNHFDYAFNFFTSFGYFNTLKEHHDALHSIVQSLKHQGILVIDYLNVDYAAKHLLN